MQSGQVWTGTNNNGSRGALNCGNWTTTSGAGNYGDGGAPATAAMQWSTVTGDSLGCGQLARLYCFES